MRLRWSYSDLEAISVQYTDNDEVSGNKCDEEKESLKLDEDWVAAIDLSDG